MTRTHKSFCRICFGFCGTEVTVDDQGRLASVRGDKDHPMTKGYTCIKGLQAPASHNGPTRLLHPLKKQEDGTFIEIPLGDALQEIAERTTKIMERYGPEAVGAYRGTATAQNPILFQMIGDWVSALGSNSLFTTLTIDQSAKIVTAGRMGVWEAGNHHMYDSDVMMLVGVNPLMSLTCIGFDCTHPLKKLKDFKAKGGTLIVIDPRRTETAQHADIFLQPYPGEDPTIAAGLLRLILMNHWHDAAFCEHYVSQMDELRAAVEPFTPDYVATRAGVAAQDLLKAAEAFARDGRRGCVLSGTGPDMAARSNLTEHLYQALNVVCGRFNRAGDVVRNPGVIGPNVPVSAQVVPASRPWEMGWKSRVKNRGMIAGEKLTGSLADEILTPGEGRIRAMTVIGGNPASSIPDSVRIQEALSDLELLVVLDASLTNTAKLAHYVIPPLLQYERADLWGLVQLERSLNAMPFSQYTDAIVAPPPGSDLAHECDVLWGIAQRMGHAITFDGEELSMENAPTPLELNEILARRSQVPFDEICRHPNGKIFDLHQEVQAPSFNGYRFKVMPDDVFIDLAAVAAETSEDDPGQAGGFAFRLASRRLREVYNSQGRDLPDSRRRRPFNPAFFNPIDMENEGLFAGAAIRITSEFGQILAIVEADSTLRQGVISMSHGWGGLPSESADYLAKGSSVNMLISSKHYIEEINAMPRMSGIPVNVTLMEQAEIAS